MGNNQLQLSEPYPVSDTYADGVGKIESTGRNLRLVFFTNREKDDEEVDHEIVARVVLPVEAYLPAIQAILRAAAFREMDISALLNCIDALRLRPLQLQ